MATAAFVQSVTATGSSPVTSSGITTTSGNAVFLYSAGQTSSVSDSYGNTWVAVPGFNGQNLGSAFYCANITGGSSHTFTVTDSHNGFTVQEWSGVATSYVIDLVTAFNATTSGTTYNSSSATPRTGSEVGLLFTFANYQNTGRLPTLATGSNTSNLSQVTGTGYANYIVVGLSSTATLTTSPVTANT